MYPLPVENYDYRTWSGWDSICVTTSVMSFAELKIISWKDCEKVVWRDEMSRFCILNVWEIRDIFLVEGLSKMTFRFSLSNVLLITANVLIRDKHSHTSCNGMQIRRRALESRSLVCVVLFVGSKESYSLFHLLHQSLTTRSLQSVKSCHFCVKKRGKKSVPQ